MTDAQLLFAALLVLFACLPSAGWTLLPEFIWLVSPYSAAWIPARRGFHVFHRCHWAAMALVIVEIMTGGLKL